jgi:uncharacterized membrane protein
MADEKTKEFYQLAAQAIFFFLVKFTKCKAYDFLHSFKYFKSKFCFVKTVAIGIFGKNAKVRNIRKQIIEGK